MGKNKRNYDSGKPLAVELKKLVVDKVEHYGGSIQSGHVPHGTFAKVSRDLSLHKSTVSKTWTRFVQNGTHDIIWSRAGNPQILSSEDEEYIHDLVRPVLPGLRPVAEKSE